MATEKKDIVTPAVEEVEYDVAVPAQDIPVVEATPLAEVESTTTTPSPAPIHSSTTTTVATTGPASHDTANYFVNATPEMKEQAKSKFVGGVLFIESKGGLNKGKFTVPKHIRTGSVLGDVKIDCSLADFVHPVTTVNAGSLLADVKIIVPRGVRVEIQGVGILGEFKTQRQSSADAAPTALHAQEVAPQIVVRGASVLASVKVKVNQDVPPINIVQ